MNKKFTNWPQFSRSEIQSVTNVLRSSKVNYLTGKYGKKFELKFSQYLNIKYSTAVSNGTVALELAILSLDIKKGDEIIVTPRSFFASVSSIIKVGAIPIFADVDIETQNISLNSIKKVLSKKTKAILCVHLAGLPCDMEKICKFAKEKKIFIIEDCAQSHGASINKKNVGTFGNVAAWSFCNDKIISTGGEGGMVTTNSLKIKKFVESYKDHGKNFTKYNSIKKNQKFRYLHDSIGSNYRITEMQSVLGIEQLKYLNKNISIRNKYAKIFDKSLKKFKFINLFLTKKNYVNAYYRYYFKINSKFLKKNWNRDKILKKLNEYSIPSGTGSCPEIYKEEAIKKLKIFQKSDLKNAHILSKNTITINFHHQMKNTEILYIRNKIEHLFKKIQL